MILFAIIDILGSIPIVISLRNKVGHIQSEKASIVALLLMIFFLFIGEEMLKIIGLDISSFAIAGSVVIFIIAMEMILGINLFKEEGVKTIIEETNEKVRDWHYGVTGHQIQCDLFYNYIIKNI
jgi:multiple antibiotic resistance protein